MRAAIIAVILMLGLTLPLFTVKVHSPSESQLTFNTAADIEPVMSSNGLEIAFSSFLGGDSEIYVINFDGTGLRQLTSNSANDTSQSISANGAKVAFQSQSGNDADIFVINSDGTGSQRLNPVNNVDDTEPAISGDGLWVAYVSNDNPSQTACPTCNNPEGDEEVFLVRTDGTGLRQLTFNSRSDLSPAVSNNGGKIAFQTNLGTWEVFAVNSDGSGLTSLTNNTGGTSQSLSISISADGSKVAFDSNSLAPQAVYTTMGPGPDGPMPYEVYTANTSGGGLPTLVSATGGENFMPHVSSDGRKVAYVSTGDGNQEVYLANSDGTGAPVRITNNPGIDRDPSPNFDGSTLALSSNRDGDFEIFAERLSCTLTGDVNGDGTVNIIDLARIGVAFGKNVGQPGYDAAADINHDGTINILDLAAAGANFGKTC